MTVEEMVNEGVRRAYMHPEKPLHVETAAATRTSSL